MRDATSSSCGHCLADDRQRQFRSSVLGVTRGRIQTMFSNLCPPIWWLRTPANGLRFIVLTSTHWSAQLPNGAMGFPPAASFLEPLDLLWHVDVIVRLKIEWLRLHPIQNGLHVHVVILHLVPFLPN